MWRPVRAWNRTLKYCYDDGTNRLTMIRSPWNTSCTTGAATTALAYDVQGNVSNRNNTTYEFDFGNRLRSASDGTTSTTYVYDAAGRRVRDITGSSRYSLYTQAGQVAYTSDARKRETTNYIYLGGSLVATSRLPTGSSTPIVEYQHTDALGTPVVVTNASRGIVQKSEYDPYGSVINRPKTDGIGFTGHVEDGATGLTYMQQRYFDSLGGLFLSVDPVTAFAEPVSNFNRYRYANSNPYAFKNPDGRQACRKEGCVVSNDDNFYRDNPIGQFVSSLFDPVALVLSGQVNPFTNVPLTGSQKLDAKVSLMTAGAAPLMRGLVSAAPTVSATSQLKGALQGAPLRASQRAISVPRVNRYADRLRAGDVPPPIKVDNGVVVDGHHRYAASRLVGQDAFAIPGTASSSTQPIPFSSVRFDFTEWPN